MIQKMPEWFDGELYEEGGVVTNPYSGFDMRLSAEELSMYDFIKGTEMFLEKGINNDWLIDHFYKGIDWFKHNNMKAYMALLD
jgi:hypothetical protein